MSDARPPPAAGAGPGHESDDPGDDNFQPDNTEGLHKFEGYEDVGFASSAPIGPPPPPLYDEAKEPPNMEFGEAAKISEYEARQALLEFVAEHCCYGKGAAEQMTMNSISPSNALHYTLETFCEARTTGRREVPYFGDAIDGPFNGAPPPAWSISCTPRNQFEDETRKLPVPHTDEIRRCGSCGGLGSITCGRCGGSRFNRCHTCGGDGRRTVHVDGHSHQELCYGCDGSGRRPCGGCDATGRVECYHCRGTGRMKTFIELTVKFKNHETDFIKEDTDMPDHLVRQVAGVELFSQVLPQVWPITTFPVSIVNDNSVRLVEEAKHAHPSERQLNQRQILRAVPVTEVGYTFKDSSSRFWVFGMERKVHSPDYPHRCCWSCNIL